MISNTPPVHSDAQDTEDKVDDDELWSSPVTDAFEASPFVTVPRCPLPIKRVRGDGSMMTCHCKYRASTRAV